MTRVGYHASHEQFSPRDLLEWVQLAEASGFQYILASDHLKPWSTAQDDSGFVWSWLGAAMHATTLPFSVVTVPGYRYHPAVLAQAIATLEVLFPGRFNQPCLGSGEALNEHVVGRGWPDKTSRNHILEMSVEIMRQLWRGKNVSSDKPVVTEGAQLYTLPKSLPKVYGAALTTKTAAWLGAWADGMITVSDTFDSVKQRIDAFHNGGGKDKPIVLKAQLSYASTAEEALDAAVHQWRSTLLPPNLMSDLKHVEQFESAGELVGEEEVEEKIKIISSPEEAIEWLEQYYGLGFETIVLHNVNRNQEQFINEFGREVLPRLGWTRTK